MKLAKVPLAVFFAQISASVAQALEKRGLCNGIQQLLIQIKLIQQERYQ